MLANWPQVAAEGVGAPVPEPAGGVPDGVPDGGAVGVPLGGAEGMPLGGAVGMLMFGMAGMVGLGIKTVGTSFLSARKLLNESATPELGAPTFSADRLS